MRRSTEQLQHDLFQFAQRALEAKVGPVTVLTQPPEATLRVTFDGNSLFFVLQMMAYATEDRIRRALRDRDNSAGSINLIVADRLTVSAKVLMASFGWGYIESSTGSIFIHAPGVRIETSVETLSADLVSTTQRLARSGIVGRNGRILAYELLRRHFDNDDTPIKTSTSKKEFDLPRSSTSDAMRALIAADLVRDNGAPIIPELFWELARNWKPTQQQFLASTPDPSAWADEVAVSQQSWKLAGTQAAIIHGAPAVGTSDTQLELYVPSLVEMSVATRMHGVTDALSAKAVLLAPPVPQIIRRSEAPSTTRFQGWSVVHPVCAALDLASIDDARSHQILSEWEPKGRAVWHED